MITHFAILEWVRHRNRGDARGKEKKKKMSWWSHIGALLLSWVTK